MDKNFKINNELIWDYDFKEGDYETEYFRKWYISRVLVRGSLSDIKNIGFNTIYKYLPEITIPYQVRKFWEWFFNLPDIKKEYESIDRKPSSGFEHNIPSPFIKG
jgi:hypothetical protein